MYSLSKKPKFYFHLVPHEFGRNTPPLIKTIPQLKQEIELLEALDDIEIVLTTLNLNTNTRLNPLDQQYEQLKCQFNPLETNDEIYILINQYLQSTHAATHQQYKMQIEQIFTIEKDNEKDLFHDVGNKMLLWYEKIFSGI
jgi:poly [ADP-ribose] polymerase